MSDDDLRHSLNEIMANASTLQQAIDAARNTPSTINYHWECLVEYGRHAETILEFGTGFSTLAWLESRASVLTVDVEPMPWLPKLLQLAMGRLTATCGCDLDLPPRRVDVLYVDTLHTYAQLRAELQTHGPHAKKIVLHDTESFRHYLAPLTQAYHPGDRGLWPAIEEFCAAHRYTVAEHYCHQHGLTILEKKGEQ